MSSSAPTTTSVTRDIETLAKDPDASLGSLKATIEKLEAERRERIEKSLQGVADLAVLGGTKGRRFVVAYWRYNEAKTAEGIEYPVELDDDDEPIGISVLIDDGDHPFSAKYASMKKFTEFFKNAKTPYYIAYFDK